MKKFFVIAILFSLLSGSKVFAQCYVPPYTWSRQINQPVYRWSWDGNLNGAVFIDGNGNFLSDSVKQIVVRNAITWAVDYWKSIVNANGTIMTDLSEDTEGNDNFHFRFIPDVSENGTVQLGFTSGNEIEINSNSSSLFNGKSIIWTDNLEIKDYAFDIKTVILHEIGHIFLGGGHVGGNSSDHISIMFDQYDVPFRSITQCDQNVVHSLYPPNLSQYINFLVTNNFTAPNGWKGQIIVDSTQWQAPYQVRNKPVNSNITLQAVSPQYDNQGYQRIWDSVGTNPSRWTNGILSKSPDQIYSFLVTGDDNGTTYQANLRKVCNVNFQNSFVGIGNGGTINVNSSQYNSPTSSFNVVELNPINASPNGGQVINGIAYYFDKWSDGDTTSNRIFYPSENGTYTAEYIGQASRYDLSTGYNLNLHTSTTVGRPITLLWNKHPNHYVT